ncbi:MAG: tRNA preQ1(34) S-adenosylmethionine ribosyltransferase-isomerase QueA [Patescibacteria group bacterium]|nr:tRNA preQ1(34) S-adenosylmethionine ribosyltransferase-isomerase QueA [Patescibacteria group bacterium]MDD5121177.1 tRNA preQ1(34) S-adenosylmethionine ribosyltransferase-isomerase QueA [Patescibacteria group bacterium]MDD5222013.1 tRNA preQ1(34) S-adenosylmethionine ribosyltransferase-isomerase QueA [Patescibacteria group bacterium]MDD5395904.1 tRNA preQ1(34) S-adenosylmethionine ribosyltransferase-isomerase QueA [Patescibacteria group bacterium]
MELSDFSYQLPKELIAQQSKQPRDHSRLMVLNRKTGAIIHDYFYNLDKYLIPGDLLVANDSRVIPARLIGRKDTGGQAEILLLSPLNESTWRVLTKNCRAQQVITFSCWKFFKKYKLTAEIVKLNNDGTGEAKFNLSGESLMSIINFFGEVPTPPYIKKKSNLKEYQTIYASANGSAAAPTAGFHFTDKLVKKLKKQKINLVFITLHVGLGTFLPVRSKKIEDHFIHQEWAQISPKAAKIINQAKSENRRIIAIGTTTVRTLESFCNKDFVQSGSKWTDIFIYPGYQFKLVDAMITNFHLPESTLLMLVSAFAGKDYILEAYRSAIENEYRFYSFGDAMLIL